MFSSFLKIGGFWIKKTCVISIVLCLISLITILATNATANTGVVDARAIALHAPARFSPTDDWDENDIIITKETPLYDVNESLYAFCFDLKNQATEQTAYIVVSLSNDDFPIIMYSPQGVSPYYDMSTKNTAVFLSAGDFYIDTGSHYTSLVNGNSIEKSELPSDVISNSAELLDNGEDFSTIRQMYIDGTFPNDNLRSVRRERNLTSVPNWQWTYGCAPTSMGMIISYHYGGSKSSILSGLAEYMSTDSHGFTTSRSTMVGAYDYIVEERGITPTTCQWASKTFLGDPRMGATYNTKSKYGSYIDAGNPVLVSVYNATDGSEEGYTGGFGDHVMTGVGYMFSDVDGDYIIVHTTHVGDGDCYISLDSSGFAEYAWGLFEP